MCLTEAFPRPGKEKKRKTSPEGRAAMQAGSAFGLIVVGECAGHPPVCARINSGLLLSFGR
jgi:hypothetical protein